MTSGIVETVPVQDATAFECSAVERIGPLTRLVFTMPQTIDGLVCNVLVCRLLVPTDMIPSILTAISEGAARPSSPAVPKDATLQ